MKKFIIFLILFSIFGYLHANPNDNHSDDSSSGLTFFEGNWSDALEKAKTENKLIFLEIHASWCGACRKLKENTFTDREAGDLYNANFINITLDGEKGEGIVLAQKHRIKAYPALLFIDHTGRLVAEVNGYHNPRRFVQLGKRVINQK